MATSLAELQSANFRTSVAADSINNDLMKKLGLRNRYEPARLAIARSLGIASQPPAIDAHDDDDSGKVIRGEHLFGTGADMGAWISLIVTHSGMSSVSKKDLLDLVRRHWHRGATLLAEDWKQCKDYDDFLTILAERAGVREGALGGEGTLPVGASSRPSGESGVITLRLGDIGRFEESGLPAEWVLNREGQSPHLGVFGKPGKGKTGLAKYILQQVSRAGVPILFIDPKGEFRDDATFATSINASIIVLGRDPIPLDALATDSGVIRVADGVADALMRAVPDIGPKQQDALREVAKKALAGTGPVHMDALVKGVDDRYRQNRQRQDVLTATLHKLQDYKLFEPKFSPADFFGRSWIISVSEVQDEALRFAMLFILDTLLRYLRSCSDSPADRRLGVRSLRTFLVIDEAKRVVEAASPTLLEGLVLECRSKGLSTFFISQSPDHLDKVSEDIVRQFEVSVSFEADLTAKAARRVLGVGATPEIVQGLKIGTCLARLPGREGASIVRVWMPPSG